MPEPWPLLGVGVSFSLLPTIRNSRSGIQPRSSPSGCTRGTTADLDHKILCRGHTSSTTSCGQLTLFIGYIGRVSSGTHALSGLEDLRVLSRWQGAQDDYL